MNAPEILIVEDSATQAERLRLVLEGAGYRVRAAGDGEAALQSLTSAVADLVVTDVMMPRMDGYELCSHIKADPRLSDVPVIVLSSLASPDDVIRGLQSGADTFIRKPYDERYLLTRVGNILTSCELRRSGKLQAGLEIDLGGERHLIDANRQQILDFLLSTYEEIAEINTQLARRSAEVDARNAELESAMHRLEAERRRSAELASIKRAVLDATIDGMALLDSQGRAAIANAELERLAASLPGVSLDAPAAENVSAVLELVADPDALERFVEQMTAGADCRGELELELPDARRFLHLFTGPVRAPDGTWLGRLLVLRDVTDEREVDRLKSELVATVSHELRTPLASVLGFAELLAVRDVDADTRHQYLQTIAEEARRLSTLVNDFLDLHKIDNGHFPITLERLDIREVVRRQVETFALQSPDHELSVDLPDAPLTVLGDSGRLVQVIANLLSNAIKYSPGGGPVAAAARPREDVVEITVRDRGLGIARDQHDRIFTKFFRAESARTHSIAGTGLGLSLCREIVVLHHGEIGFESAPGEGSEFWIRLPLATTDGRGDEND
jgi:signal transduction histidine kinase